MRKENSPNIFKVTTLLLFFLISSCTGKKPEEGLNENESGRPISQKLKTDQNGLSYTSGILKTIHGDIIIRFYPKEAPNSVNRIITLISSGFYDGLSFHRVIQNFIIQTGDPTGTGRGGSGKTQIPEFNQIPHIKGTVALARGSDPNSADSQFYIALTTLPHLDGKYTVIGQVSKGLEVLNKITKDDKILSFSLSEK